MNVRGLSMCYLAERRVSKNMSNLLRGSESNPILIEQRSKLNAKKTEIENRDQVIDDILNLLQKDK